MFCVTSTEFPFTINFICQRIYSVFIVQLGYITLSAGTTVTSGFVGTIPWGSGEPAAIIVNNDCATINAGQKTWVIQNCTIPDMAICEDSIN